LRKGKSKRFIRIDEAASDNLANRSFCFRFARYGVFMYPRQARTTLERLTRGFPVLALTGHEIDVVFETARIAGGRNQIREHCLLTGWQDMARR
jgi:hypothetical protein